MTVKELREELAKLPDDMIVIHDFNDYDPDFHQPEDCYREVTYVGSLYDISRKGCCPGPYVDKYWKQCYIF